ncbi:NADP-dependent alcohol dehydrogenase [Neocallimastix lanati (nom. inval.)]|jgi:threonine dehydrogenase-like Zn-dependent dehydrogenase|uniref:NADP-dependent alcohol dehydrogenase n=1 Tax=Neocallimastix californiae TaxID=1754190 RepID=A0A1Y2C5D5_9FUNG|nr:NADP-dependent alcohol dehydrogenase [Neocallimastix sp. JGI-2020a]ORY42084.1 NADP-dependent alcohol dehydrogenase [Neocallimastix californiae]|eukprot:ORY42084.1 NADP-dependent alcohol dehydrogenase [Neocallimastix californiae]
MKGYAMVKIGEPGWVEKEKPKCGPMDAICKPLAIAVCTSDVHTVWEGAIGDRHDMILGHECCAEVVEVGSEVKDFKPGDRVIVPAITPDWNSLEAQAGYSMHSHGMLAGWKFSNIKDGVFSEYFHVNDADGNLAHLPSSINTVDACMLSDMVPTGFHAVELADIQFGDVVLQIGIGPVGLMSVAGASLRGASRIICVGTRKVCQDVARKYGATDFISYKNGTIEEQVMKLTDGKGVDRVCIAGGTVKTFESAIKCLKPGGKIGNVNYLGSGEFVTIPRVEWGVGMGHKDIRGGLMPGGRLRMEKLASLVVAGRLDLSPLSTHVYNGWEEVPKALQIMKDKPADLIKPVIKFSD